MVWTVPLWAVEMYLYAWGIFAHLTTLKKQQQPVLLWCTPWLCANNFFSMIPPYAVQNFSSFITPVCWKFRWTSYVCLMNATDLFWIRIFFLQAWSPALKLWGCHVLFIQSLSSSSNIIPSLPYALGFNQAWNFAVCAHLLFVPYTGQLILPLISAENGILQRGVQSLVFLSLPPLHISFPFPFMTPLFLPLTLYFCWSTGTE